MRRLSATSLPGRTPPRCHRPRTGPCPGTVASASMTSAGTRPSGRPRAACGSPSSPPERCRWPRSRSAECRRPGADRHRGRRAGRIGLRKQCDTDAHSGRRSRHGAGVPAPSLRRPAPRPGTALARRDRCRAHRGVGAAAARSPHPGGPEAAGPAHADRSRGGRCRRDVPLIRPLTEAAPVALSSWSTAAGVTAPGLLVAPDATSFPSPTSPPHPEPDLCAAAREPG